ncbi:MAG: hypothetical protein NWE93_00680 [Candidatus Bathyarchaeota archaeon]|nr:hypothetical protein [Candidatus Bathyarchaeota archaeon]
MPKKSLVKVALSPQQRIMLCEVSARLGTSESETMRLALIDYAKELNLITETKKSKRNNGKNIP